PFWEAFSLQPCFTLISKLLTFIDKAAEMKSIADSMMNLNGQRQQDFSILFKVFSKGKDREKKAAGIRKVQMKFGKGCPWQTGNVKAVFPWTSRKHSMVVSILL